MASKAGRPHLTPVTLQSYITSMPQVSSMKSLQRYFQLSPEEVKAQLEPQLQELVKKNRIQKLSPSGNTDNFRFKGTEKHQASDLMVVKIERVDQNGDVIIKPVTTARGDHAPHYKLGNKDKKRYSHHTSVNKKLLVRVQNRGKFNSDLYGLQIDCAVEQELQHGEPGLLTGTVKKAASGELHLAPDLKGVRDALILGSGSVPDIEEGDHILASISDIYNQRAQTVVQPLERIWRPGHQSSKIGLHFLGQNNIRLRMPPKIDKAAEEHAKKVTFKGYKDLRHLDLVTIDGRDVNERDDAVGAEIDKSKDNPGGYIMYTAIADASAYVPVGSSWDEETHTTPFSVYAYGRNVDMLPKSIVHNYCSLDAGKDRPAIICKRRIDAQGNIIDSEFVAGIINVKANLSYDRVDQALQERSKRPYSSDIQQIVQIHHDAVKVRQQYYDKIGMLELDEAKTYPLFDEKGMVSELMHEVASTSRHDIKISMIDNGLVSWEFLEDKNIPFIGRVNEAPDPDMAKVAARRLKNWDIHMAAYDLGRTDQKVLEGHIKTDKDVAEKVLQAKDYDGLKSRKDQLAPEVLSQAAEKLKEWSFESDEYDTTWLAKSYNDAIKQVKEKYADDFHLEKIRHIILTSIKPAKYKWEGIEGHFGVGTQLGYIKNTSPLRDAAQLINQRAQKKAMGIYTGPVCSFEKDETGIRRFMDNLNEQEFVADNTQRQALNAYAIESMIPLEGQNVAAQIIGYSKKRGLAMRIDTCPVIFDIPLNHFQIDADGRGCHSTVTSQSYRFGEFIDVRINKLNPLKSTIELALGPETQEIRRKASPGVARYQEKQKSKNAHLPNAKLCKAKVLRAGTKDGITLEIKTASGTRQYVWPRQGCSLTSVQGGAYMYPTKTSPGMTFKVGETLELLVRAAEKGSRIVSVEIPKASKHAHKETQIKTPENKPKTTLRNNWTDLGQHIKFDESHGEKAPEMPIEAPAPAADIESGPN